jgi:hypothetical protein
MANYMIIKQLVTDLARFQAAFDEMKPVREKHGLKDLGEFRAAEESDIVIVMLEVADVAESQGVLALYLARRRQGEGWCPRIGAGRHLSAGEHYQSGLAYQRSRARRDPWRIGRRTTLSGTSPVTSSATRFLLVVRQVNWMSSVGFP